MLDFNNEEDFKNTWYKRSIEIEGQVMWLEKWTPDFRPDVDSPIVPTWVLLPSLPIHCHSWHYVKQLVGTIGTPLSMDLATENRTRPSMAKVRVEIDLTKPKIDSIWIGVEDDDSPLKGFTQKIEYENVPKYCRHCKLLGHSILQCRHAEKKKEDVKEKQKEVEDNGERGKASESTKGRKHTTESSKVEEQTEKEEVNATDARNNSNSKDKTVTKNAEAGEITKECNNNRGQEDELYANDNDMDSKENEKESMVFRINQKKRRKKKKHHTKKALKKKTKVTFKVIKNRQEGYIQNSSVEKKNVDKQIDQEVPQNSEAEHIGDTASNNNEEITPIGPFINDSGQQQCMEKNNESEENRDNAEREEQIESQESKDEVVEEVRNGTSNRYIEILNHKGIDLVVDLNRNNYKEQQKRGGEEELAEELDSRPPKCDADFGKILIEDAEQGDSDDAGKQHLTEAQKKCDLSPERGRGGDFNVILEAFEKLGGKPYRAYKSVDFANCMNRCGMEDAGYIGSTYTWCNNRRPSKRIWKRLDRLLFNDDWLHKFQNSVVRHLSRTGSNHRPLLLKCYDDMNEGTKYFRFLNFWSDQPGFYDIVKKE
ncbi:uncharacterized protein LOC132619559 [Lycium barbarum]|uniref:uncharacterized protein LOC132619559 n=1 Tax=Lycium barbarum TaxID=112863 RepID=UPI00293E1714|nr:uncharacterized protein LOC132619559 [Lycium barbarum]